MFRVNIENTSTLFVFMEPVFFQARCNSCYSAVSIETLKEETTVTANNLQ